MMRLRRAYATPTMLIVLPAQSEETNRVIRKKADFKEYFFRISLVFDNLDKGYYFSKQNQSMLEYVKEVLTNGIFIG